jgi:hypothetical protein
MQTLRNAHLLARFVLVWFALFIGVAAASPWVKPQEAQMVCSAMGMKMVDAQASGDQTPPDSGMDCPLCLPVAAPPSVAMDALVHERLSYAVQSTEQARLASLIGPPWQARAPPSFF